MNTPLTMREKLFDVIFGTDSPAGQRFDLILIVAILLSVFAVILDSVGSINLRYGHWLHIAEWFFTGLFTIEYITRLYCSPNRWRYARSFYGIVDLLAILPSYIALILPASTYLMVIRFLRVLRIFRVLKLAPYLNEANILTGALMQSRRKVLLFFVSVIVVSTIFGAIMYVIEGPANGFTSIPIGIYWAIVTITTVGFGDVTPHTPVGQFIASLAMLTGYAIIAIPTGIFTAELVENLRRDYSTRSCPNCEKEGHERSALYCKWCGTELPETAQKKPGPTAG
jgi:voltage-gated potassium channel